MSETNRTPQNQNPQRPRKERWYRRIFDALVPATRAKIQHTERHVLKAINEQVSALQNELAGMQKELINLQRENLQLQKLIFEEIARSQKQLNGENQKLQKQIADGNAKFAGTLVALQEQITLAGTQTQNAIKSAGTEILSGIAGTQKKFATFLQENAKWQRQVLDGNENVAGKLAAIKQAGKQIINGITQTHGGFIAIKEELGKTETGISAIRQGNEILQKQIATDNANLQKQITDGNAKFTGMLEAQQKQITVGNTKITGTIEKIAKGFTELSSLEQKLANTITVTNNMFKAAFPRYDNPYDTKYSEVFGMCTMKSAPNFFERLQKLFKNLDSQSIETINLIIRRLEMIRGKKYSVDLFSDEEMRILRNIRTKFKNAILEINENCYCYKNYFLPIKYFEPSVFYYQNGIPQISDLSRFKDKDILDVGGFVGDSALIFSPLTTKNVYSFEASKTNFELMQKTIAMNDLKNVVPVNNAVGEKPGEIELLYFGSASSQNAIMVPEPQGKEICQVIKMDDYVREHNLDVGLIKVDIEGAEQCFLRGAMETIKKFRPTMLISIYHNVDDFLDIKPMIEELNLGYKFNVFKPCIGTVSSETLLICEI